MVCGAKEGSFCEILFYGMKKQEDLLMCRKVRAYAVENVIRKVCSTIENYMRLLTREKR